MPENPEVVLTVEMLQHHFTGGYLLYIQAVGGRYKKLSHFPEPKISKYFPCRVSQIRSKGKFIWWKFDQLTLSLQEYQTLTDIQTPEVQLSKLPTHIYMGNTLGLEGRWSQTQIKFSNIKFVFIVNGELKILWYADQRNFGTFNFYLNDWIPISKKLEKLAPDLLLAKHTGEQLWNKFAKIQITKKWSGKPIVQLLMDQEALVSGIGNYLAPEILYQAKISPLSLVSKVQKKQFLEQIYPAMCRLATAFYYHNDTRYVSHLNWKPTRTLNPGNVFASHKEAQQYAKKNTVLQVYGKLTVGSSEKGNAVTSDYLIKGRKSKTYWCPKVQIKL
jgi:formamidopyrimidine-DNA glycosylase